MDIEQLVGTKLGNYEIRSLLGRGGMGVVYKARQISLDRSVALKILSPDLSSDSSFVKRFKREAEAIAQLDHSNIVQIHDIAKAKGFHFFSMQYVEGKNLAEIMKEEGRLDVNEAVRVITQAAEGIEHAHKNGIIHRDIKPSNIIIEDSGNAKVMDFGLARSTQERSKLTESGTIIGTLDYMSPEQCHGEEVDGRTDIYSLGVVLYEALAGKTPFEAPNEAALLNKILNEDPPDIQALNPDVPISLSRIILKATAKDKETRYSEIGELIEDLQSCAAALEPVKATTPLGVDVPPASKQGRRIGVFTVAAIMICLCIVGILFLRKPKEPATVSEGKTYSSIAVLPFADMSPEKDQEYFCDGISEELINALTQLEDFRVIARTSAFSFKGQNIDIRDIGRKLNVETVLEGSVRKAGNRLRITAQLVDVATNDHLWSERYDKETKDIFAIQDEITLAIVNKLKGELLGSEKAKFTRKQDVNTAAYNLYLRGTFNLYKFTPEGMQMGEAYLRQALEKDPGFAPAYAELANMYNLLPFYTFVPPQEIFSIAREAVLKALEIDDTVGRAHSALANLKMFYEWDWEGAKQEHMRAIELSPGDEGSRIGYANYLMYNVRFDEAVKEIDTALSLDPVGPNINFSGGLVYYYAGHNQQAIEFWKNAVLMVPNLPFGHIWLGRTYAEQSMYEEALAECREESEMNPWKLSFTGSVYVKMGKKEKAQQLLDELIEQAKQKYIPPTAVAWLCFELGENDKGFMWLDRAYEARDVWLVFIKVDPVFENVRSDPRYIAMLKKVGLGK